MLHEMSLLKPFQDWRARNPAKVAVAFGERSWTYSEFDRLTDNMARNILAAGAEPGDRVALHLLNGPELALSYIGCLKAGCTLVPINTRLKGREIDYILRHSGSVFYVGQPDLYAEIIGSCPAMSELHARYLSDGRVGSGRVLSTIFSKPRLTASLFRKFAPDHVAAILYTSGTTANPKGVVHGHDTVIQTARMMRQMGLDEDQVVLIMSSMAHMIGFGNAVLVGPAERRDDRHHAAVRMSEFAECFCALGLHLHSRASRDVQTAGRNATSSASEMLLPGGSISAEGTASRRHFRRFFNAPLLPYARYTAPRRSRRSSWNRPGDVRVGSIGKPGDGIAIRLIDSRGCDVEPGEVGEICAPGSTPDDRLLAGCGGYGRGSPR